MNERIQELVKQAHVTVLTTKRMEDIVDGCYIVSPDKLNKFAELIVRECITVMKSTVDESIDFDRKLDETSSWIESDIKQHFGVEE